MAFFPGSMDLCSHCVNISMNREQLFLRGLISCGPCYPLLQSFESSPPFSNRELPASFSLPTAATFHFILLSHFTCEFLSVTPDSLYF